MAKSKLRIIPLGGLGEIGRNMTLFEYGENIIVVDAGLMFPETDMFGVDIVIPDIRYLIEHRDLVRGIIVTHGHEDHHGALPYILPHVQAPIYATRLTRGLIEVKLKENGLLEKAQLHTIAPDEMLTLGPFHLEFFHVCHSIPDAVGVAIGTPVGLVVHTGDYKFDYTPVDGKLTDFHKLASFGSRGVLVLLSDSTNAERSGFTSSEQEVSESFERVFAQAEGRIIVATFASNISRVQQVMDTAVKYDRRVGVLGRSMVNNVKMAQALGYLNVPEGILLPIVELGRLSPKRVTIVCTGTQGEPTSALVRMANQDHRQVRIQPGDTVILAASLIPGNEELVHRTLNNLFRLGAQVYYQNLLPVHVSGHASQEEQKLMISLTRPRFFVPIEGEYRHLVIHAELARQMGIPRENIFVVESGQVLEFDERSGRVAETLDGGYVFVDGLGVGDVGSVVLRDRHLLSQDGFFIAVVAVDKSTGKLVEGPDIISRGFVYLRDSEELLEEARQQVIKALEKRGRSTALDDKIKEVLSRFLYEQTKRRPMILPVVLEV